MTIASHFNGMTRRYLAIAFLTLTAVLHSIQATADVSVKHADADNTIRLIQASHFLSQATMGPTVATTTALAARIGAIGRNEAFNEWIDTQLNKTLQPSLVKADAMIARDGVERDTFHIGHPTLSLSTRYYREHAWWDQALFSDTQLGERMAWALYQIIPAHDRDATRGWEDNLEYMDLLRKNAFTTHRQLLEDVTYSPVMGRFLSSLKNDKGDESRGIFPDENFAREVMQLFSIGIYDINNGTFVFDRNGNRVESYTNADITQIARIFTGLSNPPVNVNQTFYNATGTSANGRMIMWEDHHHSGTKTFLGQTIPANQSGDQDISDALDILINYKTAPYFFSNLLIQRFTTSTANINYLRRVAAVYKDNGQGIRGDLKAVIRAILMDPTIRDVFKIEKVIDPSDNSKTLINVDVDIQQPLNLDKQGRLREPMLQLANFFRFFEIDAKEHEGNGHQGDFKPLWSQLTVGQGIRQPISVFGYYSADYLPVNGPTANKIRAQRPVVLPEFELLPTFAVPLNEKIEEITARQSIIQRHTTNSVFTKLPGLARYVSNNSFAQLIQDLNIYLFSGTMSKSLQDELLVALGDTSGANDRARLSRAVAVLLSSADFAVTN